MCRFDWALFSGVVTAAATAILAFVTYLLWRVTGAQAQASNAQARAADEQLKLAKEQREAIRHQARAKARMLAFHARRTVTEGVNDLSNTALAPDEAGRMMQGLTVALQQIEDARSAAMVAGELNMVAEYEAVTHDLFNAADRVGYLTKPYASNRDKAQADARERLQKCKDNLDGAIQIARLTGTSFGV